MDIQTVTIKDYLTSKGVAFRDTGTQLVANCMFCNDEKGHFYVSKEKNVYYCQHCFNKGNIFTLAEHYSDKKSEVIIDNHRTTGRLRELTSPIDTLKHAINCHESLTSEIREYLNARGINNDLINKYKLGYGYFYGKYWITIPVKNSEGKVAFIKLRRLPDAQEGQEKYKFYPKGSAADIYNGKALKETDEIFICEGEFDSIILNSHGISAITSTGGVGTFKSEWLERLKHLKRITICFDRDDAGERGFNSLAKKISDFAPSIEIFKITFPERMGDDNKDITDYFIRCGGSKEELLNDLQTKIDVSTIIVSEQDNAKLENTEDQTATQRLLNFLGKTNIQVFTDQLNDYYVAVNGDGTRIVGLNSREFDDWIIHQLHTNKLSFGEDTIKKAKQILAVNALNSKSRYHLWVRVGKDDADNIWYDLGEKAVKITAEGWEVVANPPILFKRFTHQLEQVEPVRGGNISTILDFTNVKNDHDRILLQIYLVSCFMPDYPHPVLVVHGQHGAAKSTLFRLLKKVVDPSAISTLPPMKDLPQFIQTISHHWAAYFDNLSNLKTELSDLLCRACTGESFSKRKLYSDDDDKVYRFQHILGINGIANVVSKSDLLDRSILIELERISDENRKDEEQLNKDFKEATPLLLGACFDLLSQAIKIRPQINLSKTPRMADFAKWGAAISEAMGLGQESFVSAYLNNIDRQNSEAIEASPIGVAIMHLVNKEPTGTIEATPEELLKRLNLIAEELGIDHQRTHQWPKESRWLLRRLREISPNLEKAGVKIDNSRSEERFIIVESKKNRRTYLDSLFPDDTSSPTT
jgi:5S rRNA maturation endonuclease (ribonuclease M5)